MSQDAIESDPGVSASGLRACQQILQAGDCRSIRYFHEMDSTNSAACRDLASGRWLDAGCLPRLYLADRQTRGRGRQGRSWVADSGTLTFSVVYAIGDQASTDIHDPGSVALATGVAIARTIEHLAAPISAKIKWPNDVYIAGGKVAGVLVESVANPSDRLVVGVGLNVATQWSALAGAIAQPARSIAEVSRGAGDRYAWLADLVEQMGDAFRQMRTDRAALIGELRSRCLLTGTTVRYQLGETVVSGRCLGIDHSGALLMQTENGVRAIRSGEVSQVRRSDG